MDDHQTSVKQKTGQLQKKISKTSAPKNFFEIEDMEQQAQQSQLINDETTSPTKLPDQSQASPKRNIVMKSKSIKLSPLKGQKPQVIQVMHFNESQKEEENPQRNNADNKHYKKKNSNQRTRFNFDLQSSDEQKQEKHQNHETSDNKHDKQQIKIRSNKNRGSQNLIKKENISSDNQIEQIEFQQRRPNTRSRNEEQRVEVAQMNENEGRQQSLQEEHHQNEHDQGDHELGQPLIMLHSVPFLIRRDQEWLNKIWPQFHLHQMSNNERHMSAKLTGNNASTTFVMSQNKSDFTQNGPHYLGKVKANFIGNVINVYGPGYNPTDAKAKNQPLREIIATVEYQTNFFGSTRPRNFKCYILKKGISYYRDLDGPVQYEDELPLSQIYERGENKNKMLVMQNRKPQWNERIKGFMLNFGGRVKKASIKNFIMEDVDNNDIARLMFGKIDDNEFRLEVGDQISPTVGFGIALSTFGGKIGCE